MLQSPPTLYSDQWKNVVTEVWKIDITMMSSDNISTCTNSLMIAIKVGSTMELHPVI